MGITESIPGEIESSPTGTGDTTIPGSGETENHQTEEGQEMSETNEHTATPSNGMSVPSPKSEPSPYPDQIRALSKERSRLASRVQELEPLQNEVQQLRSKLEESSTRYTQDMSLIENHGINSERARRAIRREYREEVAEMNEADRPEFGAFVGSLKEDPFYGKLFGSDDRAKPEPAPQPQRRMMTSDPNTGTDQPKDNTRPFDEQQYRSIKSRSERIRLAKKHGLIKS